MFNILDLLYMFVTSDITWTEKASEYRKTQIRIN